MPKLNRRNFLQFISAAGVAPAIPALPASAAPAGMTSSQMLWASMLSRPGTARNAAGLARTMGISTSTVQGIHAKLIQSHLLAGHGASTLGHIARSGGTPMKTHTTTQVANSKPFRFDLRKFLTDDPEDDANRPDTQDTAPESSSAQDP